MGFSRQEYWSGLPFPSSGDFPDPGNKPVLLHCRRILYHLTYQGSQGSAYFSLNIINILAMHFLGFAGCVCGKESACQCRKCKRLWFNPLVRKIPGVGNGKMAIHSSIFFLENPMDRGAWRATVHGVEKSRTRLSNWAHTHYLLQRCVDTPY